MKILITIIIVLIGILLIQLNHEHPKPETHFHELELRCIDGFQFKKEGNKIIPIFDEHGKFPITCEYFTL